MIIFPYLTSSTDLTLRKMANLATILSGPPAVPGNNPSATELPAPSFFESSSSHASSAFCNRSDCACWCRRVGSSNFACFGCASVAAR